jgi:hypothetical protein
MHQLLRYLGEDSILHHLVTGRAAVALGRQELERVAS